jgi:hypothetical protein
MSPQSYQLIMRAGPTPGKVFPLEKSEIYIGRDITNDIVINDVEVSRKHARLTLQSGGFVLEDLGSTNGVFVNGQRITRPVMLRGGESIMLGENVSLTFEAAGYDATATVVAAPPAVEAPPPPQPAYAPPPPQPAYAPPPPPPAAYAPPPPAYAQRVPAGPAQPQVPPAPKKRRTWLWAGCGCLVILLIAAVAGVLWYIDTNALWCQLPLLSDFLPGCG